MFVVASCERKKHMFKAEEHFDHAPIFSSSGFHGLAGAGVGVAVKPVEPSSVKLCDACHQGSPVSFYSFFMLTYCELHGHIFLFETSSNWSTHIISHIFFKKPWIPTSIEKMHLPNYEH